MPNIENPHHQEENTYFLQEEKPRFSNEKIQEDSALLLQQLAKQIPDYKQRQGQNDMVAQVSKHINSQNTLVVEAGTGTGKTFSYLIGALPSILHYGKRLIISTHTVSLQTQLIKKDLPMINSLVGNTLKIEIAKGGEHYFCLKRAYEFQRQAFKGLVIETHEGVKRRVKKTELIAVENLLTQFADQDFDGDLDGLTQETSKVVIPLVQRRRDRCPKKAQCSFGDDCPYYNQRKKLNSANIIVTNHALLSLSSINEMSFFGSVEKQLLVIDEAHHFPTVFRAQSEVSIELSAKESAAKKMHSFAEQIQKLLIQIRPATLSQEKLEFAHMLITHLNQQSIELNEKYIEFDQFLLQNFATLRGPKQNRFDDIKLWKLGFSSLPSSVFHFILTLEQINRALIKTLNLLQTQILFPLVDDEAFKENNEGLNKVEMAYQSIMDELENNLLCYSNYILHQNLASTQKRVEAGLVLWITACHDTHGQISFVLSSNQSDCRDMIKSSILNVYSATIFTSATLKALGSFSQFFSVMGLDKLENAHSLSVKSPFDLRKVQFSAPIFTGDPNSDTFASIIAEQVQLASTRHQAVLVLFNSYAQMELCFTQCQKPLKETIIMQNRQNKGGLVKSHCQQIDKGKGSILFGVDSLAEGIDLKGKYLTCVMIAKFPFPNMNHPMLDYDSKKIAYYGGNPFNELNLPLCSRKLIQCVGRLIRSETDYGEIILLDSRVHTKKSYGRKLLNSLPFFTS